MKRKFLLLFLMSFLTLTSANAIDPLIRFYGINHECESSIVLSSYEDDASNFKIYKSSNSITTTGDVVIPENEILLLDAPIVEISSGFICPIGSELVIDQEGCRFEQIYNGIEIYE